MRALKHQIDHGIRQGMRNNRFRVRKDVHADNDVVIYIQQ